MKQYWARVGADYGRWIPTGCSDRVAAEDYISLYFAVPTPVKEWLLW